jgi:hypothetical protein
MDESQNISRGAAGGNLNQLMSKSSNRNIMKLGALRGDSVGELKDVNNE